MERKDYNRRDGEKRDAAPSNERSKKRPRIVRPAGGSKVTYRQQDDDERKQYGAARSASRSGRDEAGQRRHRAVRENYRAGREDYHAGHDGARRESGDYRGGQREHVWRDDAAHSAYRGGNRQQAARRGKPGYDRAANGRNAKYQPKNTKHRAPFVVREDDFDPSLDAAQSLKEGYKGSVYEHDSTHPHDRSARAGSYSDQGLTRLNKFIARAGICSRREADMLIAAGSVTVNGEVVTKMGYLLKPSDVVAYGGETLTNEQKRYFLLNKPKGYITTLDDPQQRRTVMELVRHACQERIYPVGRLDRNTTGLLLFTNDGDLSRKLTHPSTGIFKVYQVELDKPLTASDMQKLVDGIELEDGVTAVDDVAYANDGHDRRIVGIQIHSGKNRIIRRLFESMGYAVHKLDRTVFAGLTKKDLPRGRYRELTPQEVGYLKMI